LCRGRGSYHNKLCRKPNAQWPSVQPRGTDIGHKRSRCVSGIFGWPLQKSREGLVAGRHVQRRVEPCLEAFPARLHGLHRASSFAGTRRQTDTTTYRERATRVRKTLMLGKQSLSCGSAPGNLCCRTRPSVGTEYQPISCGPQLPAASLSRLMSCDEEVARVVRWLA
jgi:hypothetical protein